MTSVGEEAAPERRKGGDDTSWSGMNLTDPKIKKFTRSIQLVQKGGEVLKRRLFNLF
jgi:hypothetical protein